MKIDDQTGENHFFVHYDGWKTSTDEWVPEDKLSKDTPLNKVIAGLRCKRVRRTYLYHDLISEMVVVMGRMGGLEYSSEYSG